MRNHHRVWFGLFAAMAVASLGVTLYDAFVAGAYPGIKGSSLKTPSGPPGAAGSAAAHSATATLARASSPQPNPTRTVPFHAVVFAEGGGKHFDFPLLALSDDGSRLLAVDSADARAMVWQTGNGRVLATLPAQGNSVIPPVAGFDGSDAMLARVRTEPTSANSIAGWLDFINVSSGRKVRSLEVPGATEYLASSCDLQAGDAIACVHDDGHIALWEESSDELKLRAAWDAGDASPGAAKPPRITARFATGGDEVAVLPRAATGTAGAIGPKLTVYDGDGRVDLRAGGDWSQVEDFALSHGAEELVCVLRDGTIELRNLRTGVSRRLAQLSPHAAVLSDQSAKPAYKLRLGADDQSVVVAYSGYGHGQGIEVTADPIQIVRIDLTTFKETRFDTPPPPDPTHVPGIWDLASPASSGWITASFTGGTVWLLRPTQR